MSDTSTGDEYLTSETEPETEHPAEHPNLLLGQTFEAAEEKPKDFAPPKYVEVQQNPIENQLDTIVIP